MVVFVDDDSDLFSFFVFCGDVDVLLSPVGVDLELDFVVHLGFEDEVVETTADESIRTDVGVGHVVLGADLLLALLDLLGLG